MLEHDRRQSRAEKVGGFVRNGILKGFDIADKVARTQDRILENTVGKTMDRIAWSMRATLGIEKPIGPIDNQEAKKEPQDK